MTKLFANFKVKEILLCFEQNNVVFMNSVYNEPIKY